MCLVVAVIFLLLAINEWQSANEMGALLYGIIALFFFALLAFNIYKVWQKRHPKH